MIRSALKLWLEQSRYHENMRIIYQQLNIKQSRSLSEDDAYTFIKDTMYKTSPTTAFHILAVQE